MTKCFAGSKMIVALAAMALVAGLAVNGRAQTTAAVKAPDFALKSIDGKSATLADYRDKVVILDFWATWCGPCRMEIPHLKELQTKYGARGLQIVGIALEQDGKAVKKFAEAQGINYPLLLADGRVLKAYGDIQSIPTTFVIDRNGQILRRYVGYQSKETFERDIEPLLR